MGIVLTWKTKLLKNRYDIFQDDLLIGELKAGILSKTCQGEINGKKYLFKTKGFVTNETQILNQEDNSIAGTIIFSTWKGKARIIIANKEYVCEHGNLFDTKWIINKDGKTIIDYKAKSFSGEINAVLNEYLVILAGLFIINLFSANDNSDASGM